MKKQIVGEAKVDFLTYRRFSEFQLFKSKNPRLMKKLFYGSISVFGVMLILYGLLKQSMQIMFVGAIVIIFLLLFSFMTKQQFKKQCQLNHKLLNANQKYVFAPEGFIIEIEGEGIENREDIFYNEVYMIYEVKDAFYLYADKKHAFIVPKNALQKATPEETREFLQSKVPNYKYIIVH